MNNIALYKNGHLFDLYASDCTELEKKIALALGGVTEADLENFRLFAARVKNLSEEAFRRNCKLYVDAEQTFIQAAIESFGQ